MHRGLNKAKKDIPWKKENIHMKNKADYKFVINEYMKIREEQKHEKDIIAKCVGQRKLSYRYKNKKLEHRENSLIKLRGMNGLYEEPMEMS